MRGPFTGLMAAVLVLVPWFDSSGVQPAVVRRSDLPATPSLSRLVQTCPDLSRHVQTCHTKRTAQSAECLLLSVQWHTLQIAHIAFRSPLVQTCDSKRTAQSTLHNLLTLHPYIHLSRQIRLLKLCNKWHMTT